jgi:hypothetical protein
MTDQDNTFSWKRDFKNINWPETLKYCLIRAFWAGVAWALLGVAAGAGNLSGQTLHAATIPLGFVILYFVLLLPIGLAAGWLSSMRVPFAGFISLIFSLMVAVGDPLVFIVFKLKRSKGLPVENPGFINFKIIIFIINERAVEPVETEKRELSGSLFKKK